MANRVANRTELIVETSVGVIRDLEQFPPTSGALDSTALAFEHVLASLARLEARMDASDRRAAAAQAPPRPDPDPPDADWQRGRDDSGRNRRILTASTAVSSLRQLGLGGPPSTRTHQHPNQPGASPWDRPRFSSDSRGVRQPSEWDNHSHRSENRAGRHMPAWRAADAQPTPRPEPDPPYASWQRGRDESRRHSVILTPATAVAPMAQLGFGVGTLTQGTQHAVLTGVSPWDRYGVSAGQNHSRQPTAWDNLAHRLETRSGRHVPAWENTWDCRDEAAYSDMQRFDRGSQEQPRFDHHRQEQLRYEKRKAPWVDGSDAINGMSMGNLDYEESASIYYRDYVWDSEGCDEDADVHHDPSSNSFFEAHYKKLAAQKVVAEAEAAALLEKENKANAERVVDNVDDTQTNVLVTENEDEYDGNEDDEYDESDLDESNLSSSTTDSTSSEEHLIVFDKSDLSSSTDRASRGKNMSNSLGCMDKLFVLGWNFADHIGYPLWIDDGGDEGRRAAVRWGFDPGGDVSQQFLAFNSRRCFVGSTLRTRWISTVGELIRSYSTIISHNLVINILIVYLD